MNLKDIRPPYCDENESIRDLSTTDPFKLFELWITESKGREDCKEPQSCCLSTCTKDARPFGRMVYLKEFDNNGFKFFTNYESKKGQQIKENPRGSLCFYWYPIHKQVIINGTLERLSDAENDSYYNERPKLNQLSAFISKQSQPVKNRQILLDLVDKAAKQYPDKIPRPDNWGGYILKPSVFEFWQGQRSRLHDRFEFTLNAVDNTWSLRRLFP